MPVIAKDHEYGLTHEKLKEILHYDPETGKWTWLKLSNRPQLIGTTAGSDQNGYIGIKIFNRTYKAHRLAWFYMYGEWPPPTKVVDHKDNNKNNNKWSNLRLASWSQNQVNQPFKKNTSGIKGVYVVKNKKSYR